MKREASKILMEYLDQVHI